MELLQNILIGALKDQRLQVTFPDLQYDAERLIELECCKALKRIREILDDDTLDDASCFRKIEEIVRVYEEMGSDGGCRHDF